MTEIKANITVEYALTLSFFNCPDPNNCASAGTIYANSVPYTYNQNVYFAAGSSVKLTASPNAGYVFVGLNPGVNQVVTGVVDTVTLNGPTVVYAIFQVARVVNLATAPAGLQLYADRALVTTPTVVEWGRQTTHTLGVPSPQHDQVG